MASSLLLCATVTLTGCQLGSAISSETPSHVTTVVSGRIMGGQAPIGGAVMQLWQTGTNGYGSATSNAAQLVAQTTSNADGSFTFGTANVPTNCNTGTFAYLTGTGGDAINGTTTSNNPKIKQVAILGTCTGVGSSTYVMMNELTSVAAAYALRNFAYDGTTSSTAGDVLIGAPSTNLQGLADAIANAQLLVNSTTGMPNSSTPTMQLPFAMITTLGNIISYCVNSVPTAPTNSTNCATLFGYATPPNTGATAPNDTFQALMNIAQYPGNQVANLVGKASSFPAFLPSLTYGTPSSYPATILNDLSLGIAYPNATLATVTDNNPLAVAIDASDNVFTFGGISPVYMSSVASSSNFPTGAVTTQLSSAVTLPSGSQFENVAVDSNKNLWIASNDNGGDIVEVPAEVPGNAKFIYLTDNAKTGPFDGTQTVGANTWGIAVDSSNNVWTSSYRKSGNCASTVSGAAANTICEIQELPAGGTTFQNKFSSQSTGTEQLTLSTRGLAFDSSSNSSYNNRIWAADYDTASDLAIIMTPSAGTEITVKVGGNGNGPTGVALDASSNAWITLGAGSTSSSLAQVTATKSTANSTGTIVGTYATAQSPTNIPTTSSAPSSSSVGGVGGTISSGAYLNDAIDGAGMVWVANNVRGSMVQYAPTFSYNNGSARTSGFLSPYLGFSPSFTIYTIPVGGFSIASGVITMYAPNNLVANNTVTLSGFPSNYSYLNGATLTVASASTSKFTANISQADQAVVLASGIATLGTPILQTSLYCTSNSVCAITNGQISSNGAAVIDRAGTVWTVSKNGTLVGIIGPGTATDQLLSDGKYGVKP